METIEQHRDQIRYTDIQLHKNIVYISAGAIALSVNYYVGSYFTNTELLFLGIGWMLLLGAMISNVLSNFFLRDWSASIIGISKMNTKKEKCYSRLSVFFDRAAIIGFIVGILAVAGSVMLNAIGQNIAKAHIEHYEKLNDLKPGSVDNINSKK